MTLEPRVAAEPTFACHSKANISPASAGGRHSPPKAATARDAACDHQNNH